MRIAGMALAALLALAGCNGPASYAAKQVDTFHQRLDAGDYDAIWRDSGPDIQGATSKEAFVKMLVTVHERLGKVRESKQTGWKSNMDAGGSLAELSQQTTFERGVGEESFVYRGSGDGQKLAGYHIRSDALTRQ